MQAIHNIEPEISAEDTTAQDLKKHLNIQQFLKTHCQSRQYTFQVRNIAINVNFIINSCHRILICLYLNLTD